MKLWLYLSSCLIVLTVALHDKATADIVKVGTESPDFTLPSTKGKSFTLSAYRGIKPVIVWFSDCFDIPSHPEFSESYSYIRNNSYFVVL